jgi:hypothetical protein
MTLIGKDLSPIGTGYQCCELLAKKPLLFCLQCSAALKPSLQAQASVFMSSVSLWTMHLHVGVKRVIGTTLEAELRSFNHLQVAKVRTFQVIILQGILGSTPWNALVFLTNYLQLIGFSNFSASLALSFFQAGAALGGILGGFVGDWAAKKNSNHGRILACQFSVFMGIPFSLLVLKGLAHDGRPATVAMHVVTLFVFGLLHVWAAPACNNPVFAEIVPPELRNLVYAFDRYDAMPSLAKHSELPQSLLASVLL